MLRKSRTRQKNGFLIKKPHVYQKPTLIQQFDKSFHINGYNLLRVDHLNNIKQGCVCIYYK